MVSMQWPLVVVVVVAQCGVGRGIGSGSCGVVLVIVVVVVVVVVLVVLRKMWCRWWRDTDQKGFLWVVVPSLDVELVDHPNVDDM